MNYGQYTKYGNEGQCLRPMPHMATTTQVTHIFLMQWHYKHWFIDHHGSSKNTWFWQ